VAKGSTKGTYRKKKRSANGFIWIAGVLVVALAVVWGVTQWTKPGRGLPGLETFPEEGRDHIEAPAAVTYKTDPPTSGNHYSVAVRPGFYTEAQPQGSVVHSLEHGHVVIYYNPTGTPADVVEQLKAYANQYTGTWDGVVVLPRQQPEAVVLTAWRNMLRLNQWEKGTAERFIDSFRGRGPENPVR
jgi:hypothetical protein